MLKPARVGTVIELGLAVESKSDDTMRPLTLTKMADFFVIPGRRSDV
ncbi:MAG: hypothetical protein LC804_24055 [Acidobacteria bacterium]|nr:hypothetical protein [Acidobacteriota bacterium]